MFDRQSIHVALLLWGSIFCLIAALCMFMSTNFDQKKRRWMLFMQLFMQLTSAVLLISDALAWAFRGGTGVTGYLMVRISISMILMFVTAMVEQNQSLAKKENEAAELRISLMLFAIACKESMEAGNDGYVQFTAKTELVDYYVERLNAKCIDWHTLYIDTYGAVTLINKYFKRGGGYDSYEKEKMTDLDKFDRFGEELSDGRLTEPSDDKVYRLREAIFLSKELGRPLFQEEMKRFEI